jgi:MinD superfamily P-loop ATPase
MVDARLNPGEESSGKLVAEVRKLARDIAYKENRNTIIIDGSPGIACNVISAITGVSKAIIVTEPTISGLHDLKKVVHLVKMFSVEAKVIINKYDLSLSKAKEIKEYLELMEIEVVLELPFDVEVVNSISNLQIPSTTDIKFFSSKKWFEFIE